LKPFNRGEKKKRGKRNWNTAPSFLIFKNSNPKERLSSHEDRKATLFMTYAPLPGRRRKKGGKTVPFHVSFTFGLQEEGGRQSSGGGVV